LINDYLSSYFTPDDTAERERQPFGWKIHQNAQGKKQKSP
jgi:hypothetical protein